MLVQVVQIIFLFKFINSLSHSYTNTIFLKDNFFIQCIELDKLNKPLTIYQPTHKYALRRITAVDSVYRNISKNIQSMPSEQVI